MPVGNKIIPMKKKPLNAEQIADVKRLKALYNAKKRVGTISSDSC